MKKFKVIYENLNGKTKEVIVENAVDKASASSYVLNNYPDCFRIINVL
jgi:hypothetical protein